MCGMWIVVKLSGEITQYSIVQTEKYKNNIIPYGERKHRRIFNKHHILVHFKPCNTLRQTLFHHKDKTPRHKQSNGVHAVQWSQDWTDLYIGENKRSSEKNNMTVAWLLLTVFLIVLHAGLIYLHNCRLTGGGFGQYKHFSDCIDCIESHSLHAPEMFSSVPTAKQEDKCPKLLTKRCLVWIGQKLNCSLMFYFLT